MRKDENRQMSKQIERRKVDISRIKQQYKVQSLEPTCGPHNLSINFNQKEIVLAPLGNLFLFGSFNHPFT